MRPIKLEMAAFGPYSGLEVVDFKELKGRNLFLITGPTGSGKTTIFDAISFAMYGETSGSTRTAEGLRSHFSEATVLTEVKLTFELKGLTYHVHRIPKQLRPKARSTGFTEQKPEATLTIDDGDPKTIVAGVSSVNKKIEEVVGINAEQFKQIMMIPQGEFKKLLIAESQDREKVLQKLFDTLVYRNIQNLLNEQAKQLGSEIKSKKVERDTLITKIKCMEEDQLFEMIAAEDKHVEAIVEKTKEHIKEDKSRVKDLEKDLKEIDEKIESLIKKKAEAAQTNDDFLQHKKITEKLSDQLALADEMDLKKKQMENGEKALRLLSYEENIDLENSKSMSYKKILKDLKEKLDQLNVNLKVSKEKLEEENCQKAVDKREAITLQLDKYKSYINEVEKIESIKRQIRKLEEEKSGLSKSQEENEQNKVKAKENLAEQRKLLDESKNAEIQVEKLVGIHEKEQEKSLGLTKGISQLRAMNQMFVELEMDKKSRGEAEEKALSIQKEYKKTKIDFLLNQAAVIADELKENLPCPVCGSRDHPNPATLPGTVITEEALELIEKQQTEAIKTLNYSSQQLIKAQADYDHSKSNYHQLLKSISEDLQEAFISKSQAWQEEELQRLQETVNETINKQKIEITKLEIKKKDHKTYENNIQLLIDKQSDFEKLGDQLSSKMMEVSTQLTKEDNNLRHIYANVPLEIRTRKALEKIISETKNLKEKLENQLKKAKRDYDQIHNSFIEESTKKEELIKSITEDEKNLILLKKKFDLMLVEEGFNDFEDYTKAKIHKNLISELKKAQETYKTECKSLTVQLSDFKNKIKGKEVVDLSSFDTLISQDRETRKELTNNLGMVKSRIDDNRISIKGIETINKQIGAREEQYKVIGNLSRVAQGNNKAMMTFERYVLAAFLEDILKAANIRLQKMTQGRYIMSRTDQLQRKNRQSGLEIEVFDNFTGKSRHVKTLSGGEGFKASLSMALGLSDVVQSYAGGVRLDTMFIDEGFGTLDQESLDSAINCLVDLQSTGRLVGIISHVQELKERIDTRLEIKTSNKGSETKFVLS